MTDRLCKCGRIVPGRCDRCAPPDHKKKTNERGYSQDWRTFSERYRAEFPICEVCQWFVQNNERSSVNASTEVHHIIKISEAPGRRLDWFNVLAVCRPCHEWAEDRTQIAGVIKDWSIAWHDRQKRWR